MSGILSKVERAYALVLDKRWDYVESLTQSFDRLDLWCRARFFIMGDGSRSDLNYDHIDTLEPPPKYPNSTDYPSWWRRNSAYNVWLCHHKILREALSSGYQYIMLVEDDAIIEDDFEEILAKVEPTLYSLDWSMLYFGSYQYEGSSFPTSNPNLRKCNGGGGWHSVILRRDVIAELVHNFGNAIGPYDYICGRYIHQIYNCYSVYPCIMSQRDNIHSYVENQILKKPDRFVK